MKHQFFNGKKDLKAVLERPRWSAAQANQVLEALVASGETVAGFARRHGLHPVRLQRWRQKKLEGPSSRVKFHPVRVIQYPVSERHDASDSKEIQLILTRGRRVAVRHGFDSSLLREVVEAVENWS